MEQHESHFFARAIFAIEKHHRVLPKQLRIRVRRWVEKLVSSGGNTAYVRHRDAYTKLLLNMILVRKLDEPFNKLPPESSLPPFPTHLKVLLRPPFGQQEESFWHGVISRLHDEADAHGDITADTIINGSNINMNNSSIHRVGETSRAMPTKSAMHRPEGRSDTPDRNDYNTSTYGAGVAGVRDIGTPQRTSTLTPSRIHGEGSRHHHHVAFSEQKHSEPAVGDTPSKFGGIMHSSFVRGDPPRRHVPNRGQVQHNTSMNARNVLTISCP